MTGPAASPPAPGWAVHLATAGATVVRLACPPAGERDPWPLTRALHALGELGVSRADRPHAVGAGRGVPLIHSQEALWEGCALHLEAHHQRSSAWDELCLELPGWDELVERVAEDDLWELVDRGAAACDAGFGIIGDGEALEPGAAPGAGGGLLRALLRRSPGALVREGEGGAWTCLDGARYRSLPRSGLAVHLR